MTDRFYEAIRFATSQPTRAACRLWDILWDLSRPAQQPTDPRLASAPAAVQRACQMIEQFLWRKITVPWLAEHVDLTADHLCALFRKHLDTTVVGYMRQRRVLRAKHLLVHSSIPLKAIAQQVGIPDPHHFNKTIRRELGASPSRIRNEAVV
jgi:transcriptional regulator GlxA family with amidase domain